ncbi:MAG: DNA methyltransferase, partial [Nitrosopumilaceae archaeon]
MSRNDNVDSNLTTSQHLTSQLLILGDSLSILRGLPNDTFGFGVSSSPYERHLHKAGHIPYTSIVLDLGNMNGKDFDTTFIASLKEVYRIWKQDRILILIVGDEGDEKGSDSGFPHRQLELCKEAGWSCTMQPTALNLAYAKYAIYCKKGELTQNDREKIKRIRFKNKGKLSQDYEAAFDICIPLTTIAKFAHKDEPVLDLWAGIGTTLIACNRLGFDCMGIDINPKAVAIYKTLRAKERELSEEDKEEFELSAEQIEFGQALVGRGLALLRQGKLLDEVRKFAKKVNYKLAPRLFEETQLSLASLKIQPRLEIDGKIYYMRRNII